MSRWLIALSVSLFTEDILKHDYIAPNVPYSIKGCADLIEAKEIGLKACDKQREKIEGM